MTHQEPHIALTSNGGINLVYFNAGGVHIYGTDLDITARPWLGGTLSFSGEYAHSVYTDFKYDVPSAFFNPSSTGCSNAPLAGGTTHVDCTGFQVARTPELSGSLGVAQEFAVGRGEIIADADVSYASGRWLSVDFLPIERAPAYAQVNLNLTYQAPDDRWSVTSLVRNLNNGRAYTFSESNPSARAGLCIQHRTASHLWGTVRGEVLIRQPPCARIRKEVSTC